MARNKCSHAHIDQGLTANERQRLAKGGLNGMLADGRLQLSARMIPEMVELLILFFNEIEAATPMPSKAIQTGN